MRNRPWRTLRSLAPLVAIAGFACLAPPIEAPGNTVTQETPIRVPQNPQNKVDILFMVDNSRSMDAMQVELRARLSSFFGVFDQLATNGTYADMHIGVVTSDYGAGHVASPTCDASPGGQFGHLQAIGLQADASCKPPTGAIPFIQYQYTPTGPVSNLPPGVALGDEFACMASVGSGGCGFEHQLESVYAALRNNIENKGFLRDDALLAVVFLTNEDDGSAPPMSNFYSPNSGLIGKYGAYDTYRQTRFAVACGDPPMLAPYGDSMGPLAGCQAAPVPTPMDTDVAYDITRYINFFTQPAVRGGVKDVPDDVILVGIMAPTSPFEVVLTDQRVEGSGLGVPPHEAYEPCPTPMISDQCLVRLQHSCQHPQVKAFFGDPPIRIASVITKALYHFTTSICGDYAAPAPNYDKALATVANLITSNIGEGCVPEPLTSLTDPDCAVEDVTYTNDGTTLTVPYPRCDRANGAVPCWKLEQKPKCATLSPQGVGVTVMRNGPALAHTVARVSCATVASKS